MASTLLNEAIEVTALIAACIQINSNTFWGPDEVLGALDRGDVAETRNFRLVGISRGGVCAALASTTLRGILITRYGLKFEKSQSKNEI